LLLALAACGSKAGAGVSVAAYDRSCASVVDCIPVVEGTPSCCGDGCATAAVNARVVATYEADRAAARAQACQGAMNGCPVDIGAGTCPAARIACVDGLCAVLVPDAGADATAR